MGYEIEKENHERPDRKGGQEPKGENLAGQWKDI